MTKFILHGGNTRVPHPSNREFFIEMTKGLLDGSKILLVLFSRDASEYDSLLEKFKKNILSNIEIDFVFDIANEENFIDQIKDSKLIYMKGGDTIKLLDALKQYPDFRDAIKGKIVAGSSAGAYVLSKYFYSRSEKEVVEGLGILPIRTLAHYDGDQDIVDKLNEYSSEYELVLLKDYESRIIEV